MITESLYAPTLHLMLSLTDGGRLFSILSLAIQNRQTNVIVASHVKVLSVQLVSPDEKCFTYAWSPV